MDFRGVHAFAIAIVAALVAGGAGAGEPPEKTPKVGVVDVGKIFENYKRTKEGNEKMKLLFEGRLKALEGRRVAIQKKGLALRNDTRARTDLSFIADKQSLELGAKQLEQDFKKFLKEKEDFNFKHTRLILAEVKEAVRRYAESHGFDLVIQVNDLKIEGTNTVQVMKSFRSMTALYFSKSMDLTPRILAMLDRAYDKGIRLVVEETLESGPRKR